MRSWAPHSPALVFLSSQLADQSGIREQFHLPLNTRGVPEWQQTTRVNPTPCHAVEIIKQGYSLRLARRPPRFSCVVPTSVQSKDAHVLCSEVMALLAKGAINGPSSPERVMLLQPLLPRPQKDGGLRGPSSISEPWTTPSLDGCSGWFRWNRSTRKYAQGTGSFPWIWKTLTFTSR